jgi:putative transposase
MPRRRQEGTAGLVFHVINRGAKRSELFSKPSDYQAFENLLIETRQRWQIPLLAYCLMPNHWHLVLWPDRDVVLSKFMHDLTFTHARRWNAIRGVAGNGAVYQGRYKAIAVQHDQHFLRLCAYVERNPLRSGLVKDLADWKWSSFWRRLNENGTDVLSIWPTPVPENWPAILEQAPEDQEQTVRRAVRHSRPLGNQLWSERIAAQLRLTSGVSGRRKGCRVQRVR